MTSRLFQNPTLSVFARSSLKSVLVVLLSWCLAATLDLGMRIAPHASPMMERTLALSSLLSLPHVHMSRLLELLNNSSLKLQLSVSLVLDSTERPTAIMLLAVDSATISLVHLTKTKLFPLTSRH